jgi:anti-sigma-K factor RskA
VRHPDEEDLATVALGEDVPPEVADHVGGCAACRAEVAELSRVLAVARTTTAQDVPSAPSPEVWDRVRAELGLGRTPAPVVAPPPPVRPASPARREDRPGDAGRPRPAAEVRPLPRRRVPVAWIGAAAAAGLVLGGVGGALWASSRPEPASPQPTVLAQADLAPLPGWEAGGSAVLEEDEGGRRVVVVDVDAPLGDQGYREVWLIAPDLSGMVSLGLLEGSHGSFTVPDGLDVARYPVVDVSEEPFDGDATHSGDSIVRGTLVI